MAVAVNILLIDPMLNDVSVSLGRLASRSAIPYARSNTGAPFFASRTTPENSSSFTSESRVPVRRRTNSASVTGDDCGRTCAAKDDAHTETTTAVGANNLDKVI